MTGILTGFCVVAAMEIDDSVAESVCDDFFYEGVSKVILTFFFCPGTSCHFHTATTLDLFPFPAPSHDTADCHTHKATRPCPDSLSACDTSSIALATRVASSKTLSLMCWMRAKTVDHRK